jgi:hypothetical protein
MLGKSRRLRQQGRLSGIPTPFASSVCTSFKVSGKLAVVPGGDGGKVLGPTIRIERAIDRVGERTMDPLSVGGACAGVDGGSNQWVSKLQRRLRAQQSPANCFEFGVFVTSETPGGSAHQRSVPRRLCSRYENERLCFRG